MRLLDSYFARYGYAPLRTVAREGQGVRFRLPANVANVGQTGLYSYFALAGDFEVSANYELLAVPKPANGYGASCGLAADAADQTTVSLARGQTVAEGNVYVVTVGRPGPSGVQYESTFHATTAKAGKLVLRREKGEVVYLVADDPAATPRELARVPFPLGAVRPIRLYADLGGARTGLDARLTQIRATAVEVAGGVPVYEPSSGTGWWWAAGGVTLAIGVAGVLRRRRRAE